MDESEIASSTRRGVMKGIGGLAALSMSNMSMAEAQEVLASSLPTDPHTRDTYRSIVDAIVPRTPELEEELGPEHVPGGLEIELEKFIIWDFNHFQEIRLETLLTPAKKNDLSTSSDRDAELMDPDMFRVDIDTTDVGSDLDALLGLADASDGLDPISDVNRFEELLDFGAVEQVEISFANAPLPSDASGPAEFELLVETGNETVHRVMQNYPYAPMFPFVFDVVAAEFILRGENEDAISRRSQFAAGGTFTRLSREDRLRCLWEIVEGSTIDRLDGLLSPLVPQLGILKYVVMAVNGLHGFGYYTEWSGYGDTKTEMPSDREMATPAGRVQSRDQTGYPGPEPGFAADWRHVLPGGFDDPSAEALDLPHDLTGDDVLSDDGGDA